MSAYKKYLQREPKLGLSRTLKITAWLLTAVVLVLVGMMRRPELKIALPDGISFGFLPPIHAALNSIVAIALVVAVMAIKNKNVKLHTRAISVAMVSSVLFLLCYVAYHFTTDEVRYGGVGIMRSVYFTFLISHIVLAAVSLPFILFTWINGLTNQFAKHKKLARWVFPMWLYVAVTGPICYLLLKPYY
jgi:putative membrane protein